MNPWIKRGAAGVLGLAGFWLLLRHLRRLLDWPHLYPDLGRLHMGNLVLGGLTLLLTALAWISLVYLFLNRERKLWPQIAAGVSFAVLLLLAGVSMTGAVGDIPCSYTTSLSAYRQEFQTREYIYRGVNLCPFHPEGEISGYARDAMSWAVARGLVNGVSRDGAALLFPRGGATRAQVAAILMRFLG